MRLLALASLLLVAVAALQAAPPALPSRTVIVAPMKTSIYVGSVKLNPGVLTWQGDGFATTYEAKVTPWFFWGESGTMLIKLTHDSLGRLAMGETVEFTGDAVNEKKKTRSITGRAQPNSATTGKIKVRIMADGVELIFNSTYEFTAERGPDKT
ncbi:hypothetical protein [Oleiharenicola lentus]|uniref:hypothetical protein n=1 Tax=Oleiharenicola lentus TaxID=2508720 RepID=UPI003F66CCA4